jgi:hypothetical protein
MKIQDLDGVKNVVISNNALAVIETDHQLIHDGKSFVVSGQEILASSATRIISFLSPNSDLRSHIAVSVRSTGEANFKIYENSTITGGSSITPINRNRNSSVLSESVLKLNPVINVQGNLLFEDHFGAGINRSGESRTQSEFILNKNTLYTIVTTSETASNEVTVVINWYEIKYYM